jgi:hypothetical protein
MDESLYSLIIDSYIDFTNYTDPLKYFLDDSYFFEVEPSKSKKVIVNIAKNLG